MMNASSSKVAAQQQAPIGGGPTSPAVRSQVAPRRPVGSPTTPSRVGASPHQRRLRMVGQKGYRLPVKPHSHGASSVASAPPSLAPVAEDGVLAVEDGSVVITAETPLNSVVSAPGRSTLRSSPTPKRSSTLMTWMASLPIPNCSWIYQLDAFRQQSIAQIRNHHGQRSASSRLSTNAKLR